MFSYQKWGISESEVLLLCTRGKIDGAQLWLRRMKVTRSRCCASPELWPLWSCRWVQCCLIWAQPPQAAARSHKQPKQHLTLVFGHKVNDNSTHCGVCDRCFGYFSSLHASLQGWLFTPREGRNEGNLPRIFDDVNLGRKLPQIFSRKPPKLNVVCVCVCVCVCVYEAVGICD